MAARGGVDIKLVQRQLQVLGHDLDEAAIAAFVEKMNLDSQPVAKDGDCQQRCATGLGDLSDSSPAPTEDTSRPQHQKTHQQPSSGSSRGRTTGHAGHKMLDQRCRRFLSQMPARPAATKALAAQQQQRQPVDRAARLLPRQVPSSSASDVSDCSDSDDQEASSPGGDSDDCVLFEPTHSSQQPLAAAVVSCGADRCAAAASALPRFGFRPGYLPVGIHIPPPAAGCEPATITAPAPRLRTDVHPGLRGSASVQELQQQLAALRDPAASVEPPAAAAGGFELPRPPATRQPTSAMQLAGGRGSTRQAAALARNSSSSSSTSKALHRGSLSVGTSMLARGSNRMLPPPAAQVAPSSSSRSIGIGSSSSSSSRAAGRSCGAAHGSLAQYSARLSSGGPLRSKAIAPGVRPTDRVARFHQMRRLWQQDRFLTAGTAKGLPGRIGGTQFVEMAEWSS